MNDAPLVRVLKRLGDLFGNRQRFPKHQRPLFDPLRQHGPVNQFHCERAGPAGFFESVEHRNVGMIQRSKNFGFPFEARHSLRIAGKRIRHNL